LDDGSLSGMAKQLRHQVRQAIPPEAIRDRDTAGDVGTALTADGAMARARLVDLIRANAARVSEALRAAEEACKLANQPASAAQLEQIRYRTYQLESGMLSRLPAWLLLRIRLYALVDTSLTDDAPGVAGAVVRGGAGAVQLRSKDLTQRAYRELAGRVQEAVRREGGLFIVNDHVAVAHALHADGVHLGQDDLAIHDARSVLGAQCAIGISAHTPAQAAEALAGGADYLGLGPMFQTATKAHEPARGAGLLDEVQDCLRAHARRASYAIGGLTLERVRALRPRLPHGVAVASALCRASDPERTASEFLSLLEPDELP
jgi:thiamine-phosphate pyrophosphorylase